MEIVRKIKETLCYMIISSSTSEDSKKTTDTPTNYTLPDGTHIQIKDEKVTAPEILFNPSLIGLENLCKKILI